MNQTEGLAENRRLHPGLVELEKRYPWPQEKPNAGEVPIGLVGWMTWDVQAALIHFSIWDEPRIYLELGSWFGLSMRMWLGNTPMGIGIAVDTWEGSADFKAREDIIPYLPISQQLFFDECWLYRDRLIPLKMRSLEGMQIVYDQGVRPNLIYIDADHTYEAVLADFSLALDLFPGAMIMGDDYLHPESSIFGVHRAVNDVARERGIGIMNSGHCWWIA
jgi:hypothetical protein